jgi:electron transfer flavoprotein beta subunit
MMKIYVCVKHVPDTAANIRPQGCAGFDETVKFIMNPYDEYALEQALRVRENSDGSEVIAVTAGGEASAATLRFAMAMGADRGILIKKETYFGESLETACLLKQAIAQDGSPSLIFMGKQSVDAEGMQVHFHLAALFDMPIVVGAVAFSMTDGLVTVERECEGGASEVIEMTIPCVIGAARGLNQPRSPTLPDMMRARKKEIHLIEKIDIPLPFSFPQTEMLALHAAPERGRGKILHDMPMVMASELLGLLREEARVL